MTAELEALGRRAIATNRWGWVDGMLTHTTAPGGLPRCEAGMPIRIMSEDEIADLLELGFLIFERFTESQVGQVLGAADFYLFLPCRDFALEAEGFVFAYCQEEYSDRSKRQADGIDEEVGPNDLQIRKRFRRKLRAQFNRFGSRPTGRRRRENLTT